MSLLATLLPPGLTFRDPLVLLLLLVVPVAVALRIARERKGETALVVPTLAFVANVKPGWRVRFRHLPFILACLGFAGLVVALARPRVGLERTESWTEGVDIVVALDASGSMAAEDFKPKNRFFVAKAATRTFVTPVISWSTSAATPPRCSASSRWWRSCRRLPAVVRATRIDGFFSNLVMMPSWAWCRIGLNAVLHLVF